MSCENIVRTTRRRSAGPRFFVRIGEPWKCTRWTTEDRLPRSPSRKTWASGLCNITKCCTEVCPEGIHITDNALIPLKERVADKRYDPLFSVGSLFRKGTKRRDPAPPTP